MNYKLQAMSYELQFSCPYYTVLVWDATSLVYVDIGSMHVVEQHDDLFSWKKYNNYTHVNAVQKYRMWRMLFERGNKLFMQKYNVLTLLTIGPCCVMSQMSKRYF